MKVFVILAVICAMASAAVIPPAPPLPPTHAAVPSNGTVVPAPATPVVAAATRQVARDRRYILLESGGVYDTLYDIVLPASRTQYVIQRGQGANRDIYLRTGSVRYNYNTIPLRDYVISTV